MLKQRVINRMLKKLSLFIIYCIFGIVLIATLLVIRFPKDRFLSFFISFIEQEMAGYTCEITEPLYRYPSGLYFNSITLIKEDENLKLPLTDVLISVDLKTMLKQCNIRFDLFGGSVRTEAFLRAGNRVELSNIVASDIDFSAVDFLQHRFDRKISGVFAFKGDLLGERQGAGEKKLTGSLEIINFRSVLKRPILMSDSVEFDTVNMLIRVNGRQITLTGGQAKGPLYDGNFSGLVEIAPGWRAASLAIEGRLSPRPEYIRQNRFIARTAALLYKKHQSTRIPYRVSGSFREPVFQFGNVQ